jgi:hypothetical protein
MHSFAMTFCMVYASWMSCANSTQSVCVRVCQQRGWWLPHTLTFTAAPFVLLFQFSPSEFLAFCLFIPCPLAVTQKVSTCARNFLRHVVDILWCAHMHIAGRGGLFGRKCWARPVCHWWLHSVFISLFIHSAVTGSPNLLDICSQQGINITAYCVYMWNMKRIWNIF